MLTAAVGYYSVTSASISPLVTVVYVVAGGDQIPRALAEALSNHGTRSRIEQHNHKENNHSKTEFSMAIHPCTPTGSFTVSRYILQGCHGQPRPPYTRQPLHRYGTRCIHVSRANHFPMNVEKRFSDVHLCTLRRKTCFRVTLPYTVRSSSYGSHSRRNTIDFAATFRR